MASFRCLPGESIAVTGLLTLLPIVASATGKQLNHSTSTCMLYIAPSTIPNAGIGVFAGTDYHSGQTIGRDGWGDPIFATIDVNWNNADPDGTKVSKYKKDYHWPLSNYGWSMNSLKLAEKEGDQASMTGSGISAMPNCHFSLTNVKEHGVSYDLVGMDRYNSPGSGAITPFFNRTSTAKTNIYAGSELFVNYGSDWFKSREDYATIPVKDSYIQANRFLTKYGLFLLGYDKAHDGWKLNLFMDNMILKEDAQKDLWDIIKTFPYASRARQALPATHNGIIKALHKGIGAVEVENSMRSLEYLETHGRCVDNIVPGNSTIPHAGRGAFATRFIPKGGLVAPAPLIHLADKSTLNMYNEMRSREGKVMKNEKELLTTQLIRNYMFGHPNSSVVLLPYSSYVSYINHHSTNYNARLQWATNFSWHKEEWLSKDVIFLGQQWDAGLMLEFIVTRDINEGEEIFIDYGVRWQQAWDQHVKDWTPVDPAKDYNNYTFLTKPSSKNAGSIKYRRAEYFKMDGLPVRTESEQETNPYPRNVVIKCRIDVDIGVRNNTHEPQTIQEYKRKWRQKDGKKGVELHECKIVQRRAMPRISFNDENAGEKGPFLYKVELNNVKKKQRKMTITEKHVITDVPVEAIELVNVKYSSDMFLKNAFRHEMELPDGLWPEAWMNLIQEIK